MLNAWFGRQRAASVALLVTVIMLASPTPTHADEKPAATNRQTASASADPRTVEIMRRQAVFERAANKIVASFQPENNDGYLSIAFEEHGIALRWKGDLPPAVRAAVEDARRITNVRVHPVRYSHRDLQQATKLVTDAITRQGLTQYHGFSGGEHGLTLLSGAPDAARSTLSSLPAVGVPVTVAYGERIRTKANRQDDSEPWWGGAAIHNNTRNYGPCTSGFAATKNGLRYLVTAAHCATPPDVITDPPREWIGQSVEENWQHDTILIAANSRGKIYDGGVWASTAEAKEVTGWSLIYRDQYYCQSGGASGTVCGLKATGDGNEGYLAEDSDGDTNWITSLWKLKGACPSAQPGDSGAPVFILDGSRVKAKGIVSGGDGCTTVMVQDWGTIANDFSITTLTYGG